MSEPPLDNFSRPHSGGVSCLELQVAEARKGSFITDPWRNPSMS